MTLLHWLPEETDRTDSLEIHLIQGQWWSPPVVIKDLLFLVEFPPFVVLSDELSVSADRSTSYGRKIVSVYDLYQG